MAPNRRRDDSCIIVRLWNSATPYIQIAGFLITIASVIFFAGGTWQEVKAHGPDIESLKIWRSQEQQDMAVLKQQVRDIHDYLIPRGK